MERVELIQKMWEAYRQGMFDYKPTHEVELTALDDNEKSKFPELYTELNDPFWTPFCFAFERVVDYIMNEQTAKIVDLKDSGYEINTLVAPKGTKCMCGHAVEVHGSAGFICAACPCRVFQEEFDSRTPMGVKIG